MEYLDLSPYAYTASPLPMTSVGWLGSEHGVQGGTGSPLTEAELRTLRAASRRVCNVMLGFHPCEFCEAVEGNGEYRYYLPGGRTFAAPAMIVHYAERHGYRPPREFLDGLPEAVRPAWDGRAESLREVLLDGAAGLEWRAEAAVDLAQWNDRRAFDALRQAVADAELADCAGDEIGRSLAAFAGRDYAAGLDRDGLPPSVRFGVADAARNDALTLVRRRG
ncbi:DUF7919 family protein [Catenuloplanes atrovinosus]|uniref:DUF7919 domain-containing protein n=1 Tax=Catenuloplanes atrovinosus TaxID=137266 RepID=A0AAE4C9W1_9ACTN|nr:hypothetical protein [Catenuloplanes atrovinosus]MDR7275219.1 hypothetical protein [Catenuloplanes atrovinosus]